jgi:hypothetical protein
MNVGLNLTVQVPVVIGTLGLWAQAKKRRIAPALGFLSEFTYLVWALWFGLWGFIPWAVIWGALYARTYLKWTEDALS